MTTTINDNILSIPLPSVDFDWTPKNSAFVVTVNGNTYPPTADPRYAASYTPTGTPITFTATILKDPSIAITEYRWDTGDGFIKFGASIIHTFTIANPNLEMALEVTDSLGRKRSVSHVLLLQTGINIVVDPNITG